MDERSGGHNPQVEVESYEVQQLLETGSLLLDVREIDEWQVGHAPTALHIPLGELAQRWRELPEGRDVVVVCRSGHRSAIATEGLRGAGVPARNLAGGMLGWAAVGLPIIDDDGRPGDVA